MNNKDLLEIGFKEVTHFTIGNNVTYDLGQNRILSASNVGTPNETLFISEVTDNLIATDIICLHNYDFDGPLDINKVKAIINAINWNN